jgi:hypothetical protein
MSFISQNNFKYFSIAIYIIAVAAEAMIQGSLKDIDTRQQKAGEFCMSNLSVVNGWSTCRQTFGYTCPFCGCVHLNSSSKTFLGKCCNFGKYLDETEDGTPQPNGIPELKPLLPTLLQLALDPETAASIGSSSSSYNNLFSFGKLNYFISHFI